ncbi:MAG TPA: cohesin domain-containing protein, partial [Wenzhouxiangella sp.]
LQYLEHWAFDTTSIDADNNPNGRIESGETIDLALVIRNHWGKADNVSVTLEAKAPSAVAPDPYITMITDTVNYGAVSSFSNDDNGLVRNGDGLVVGVDNPFRFSVSDSAPNNHLIVFQVTITADNGFDADEPSTTHKSVFYAMVQRGRMLDSVISADMTLTNDEFWIVPGPVLIPTGVTVDVDPGTQIQWGGAISDSPYEEPQVPYVQVEGTLMVNGTEAEPVEMFGQPFSSHRPQIVTDGHTELHYCLVEDPRLGLRYDAPSPRHRPIDVINHCRMYSSGLRDRLTVIAGTTTQSQFILRKMQRENNGVTTIYGSRWPQLFFHDVLQESWIDIDGGFGIDFRRNRNVKNNVITPNDPGKTSGFVSIYGQSHRKSSSADAIAFDGVRYNAFLNRRYETSLGGFRRYYADFPRERYFGVTDNFWDMPSDAMLDVLISDGADDFNRGVLEYSPVTSTPHATTYPYVTNIDVQVNGVTTTEVGAETMDITVAFNRDMDTDIDPMVSFGPAEPYTDFMVSGAWTDARNWQGSFKVNPITGDGFQYFRVINAVAADDAWLKTGNDYYRFRFEIITSGSSAMSMQASGGEGQVSLWWSQDDFDTLAGFNLYRAPVGSSNFQRVNNTLIPQGMTTWTDNTVTPGQPYQYYFKVVKTDLSESEASNIAQATALDTISPTMSHTPITGAAAGQPLTFRATVSDNVSVQSVTLFHRAMGQSTWQQNAMSLISNRYAVTLDGSTINAPGLEYYIEASDGVNVTRSTLPATPHAVVVDDRPVVTAISPTSGPAAGGTVVTITGSNFDAGASVRVGQSVCANVTVTSTTSIQCTTNQHIPEVVDVRVTNPNSAPGLLVGGFRYLSDTATLSLPNIVAGRGQTIEVPVSLNNSQGMVSAQFTINFDPSVIKVASTTLGNLTAGWTQAVNTSQAGAITVSMATGGGGVSADGSVLRISFEAHGQPGETTALTLSNVAINDGSIPVQVGNGQIEIDSVHQIQGQVSYWNGSRPVDATSMVLTSDQSPINGAVADSASNGAFSVFAPAGTHLLIPRRNSAEGGISALDASLALRHATNESPLTGHALTAADVNRSGAVTAHDAFLILQHVVGLSSLPFTGAGEVWVFAPEHRSFSNLASPKANQHFTGILLGDPSGNWGEQAPASISNRALSQPSFNLSSGWADQGNAVTTTLSIGASSSFYALEFDLMFDPSVVEVVSVTPNAAMNGWSVLSNTQQSGRLRVASAGSQAMSGPADLLSIQFRVLGAAGSESALSVSNLKVDESAVPSAPSNASLFSGEPRPIFRDQFMKQ